MQEVSDYQSSKCPKLRAKILADNMGLIYQYVNKFSNNKEDLVQEGVIGFLVGLDKFDVTKEVKFSTYIVRYISGYVKNSITAQNKLRKSVEIKGWRNKRNVRKEMEKLERSGIVEASEQSKVLGISEEDVRILKGVGKTMISLSANDDEDSSPIQIAGGTVPEEEYGSAERASIVRACLESFTGRDRAIIEGRLLGDLTLEDIGSRYGVTRERVRQVESKLIKSLQTRLSSLNV
jgi:RNA polymerase sigma-32 factor